MKKISSIFALTLAVLGMAGCAGQESAVYSPVAFSAELEEFHFINKAGSTDVTWRQGDKVGVAVHATRELSFVLENSGAESALSAVSSGFTAEYGDKGYACVPAGGYTGFLDMKISIPASQKIIDGHNPSLVNSVAYSNIADDAAVFRFRQMGAVVSLGLSSSADIRIAKLQLTATEPAAGSFLAGSKDLKFQTAKEFVVNSKVSGGANTVELQFPDGLALSSSVQYVNAAVLPFSTNASGLKLVITDINGHTCTKQLLSADSEIGKAGAISLSEGDFYTVNVGNIAEEDFDIPAKVTLRLVDKSSGNAMADHDVYIYSVSDGNDALLGTFRTDASGVLEKELNPGTYKFAAKYNEAFGPQWNALTMELKNNEEKELTLEVLPIIFADDFSWCTAELAAKDIKPYYVSFNPPAYNANALDESMLKESSPAVQAKLAEIGWEWTISDFAYIRPGMIKFGKKNGTGSITTPAFGKYSDSVPSSVLLKLTAISWNNSPDKVSWVYEKSQLRFTIIGGGSFAEGTEQTEFTSGLLNAGTPPDYYTVFELPIYGATGSTQVKISSVKQASGSQWRCMVDDVRITPLIK